MIGLCYAISADGVMLAFVCYVVSLVKGALERVGEFVASPGDDGSGSPTEVDLIRLADLAFSHRCETKCVRLCT